MPEQNTPPTNSPPDGQQQNNRGFFHTIIVIFIITLVINLVASMLIKTRTLEIEYSQFLDLVEAGYVAEVSISDEEIDIKLKSDADMAAVFAQLGVTADKSWTADRVSFSAGPMEDPDLMERLRANGITFGKPIVHYNPILSFLVSWILPIFLIYLLYYFMMKRMSAGAGGAAGGIFSVGKSTAKVYDIEKSTGVTFADVAGQEEAKDSLREIVDFLHHPDKYQKIGATQPKGALLVGPPGTGKTLLAKAVAGEARVPFFSITGSEFVEMFVGVGASRVRDLFAEASKNAPCIIFIDEIDAIGKSRDNQLGSNDEREQTLNQLLSEMDGFDGTKGIMVLAATNRPEVLDKALLRPGRFDRRIIVDKPDLPGREAILQVHAKKVVLGSDVDLHEIAVMTSGATGADLANMINEAALRAVRMGRDEVLQEDLMESVEVVIAGKEKKDRILGVDEKRRVAYHEVGHALVTAMEKDGEPVQKITIVPRTMGSLGYTMAAPEEEKYLMTKDELLAKIATLTGGRAAEELIFGTPSTGASNDIEQATKIARGMVTQYGMSDELGMVTLESGSSQYLDGRPVRNCAEETSAEVDEEVRKIIASCHERALELLKNNRPALEKIAEYLIEKETITGKQFMELLHDTEHK